jgi:hypothetical protein
VVGDADGIVLVLVVCPAKKNIASVAFVGGVTLFFTPERLLLLLRILFVIL